VKAKCTFQLFCKYSAETSWWKYHID